MNRARPCMRIDTGENYVIVHPRHYDTLRDELDRGEKGWREYDLAEDPSGKAFLRLEDIQEVTLYPPAWCDAKNERDAEDRADAIARGEE